VLSYLEKFIDSAAKKLYCKLAYLLQGCGYDKKKGQINSEPNTQCCGSESESFGWIQNPNKKKNVWIRIRIQMQTLL
jgi:hypothetical protein